jgi:predicted peptidase
MRTIVFRITSVAVILLLVACKKETVTQVMTSPPAVIDVNLVAETSPAILKPVTIALNDNTGGLYTAVPANYTTTTKSYPLLISIHGGGQYGNGVLDLPLLLNDGIPQLLDEKIFPPNFSIRGVNFSFIVIAPQLKTFPVAKDIKDVIDFAKKTYRVDISRIYITGLSNGGAATCLVAGTYANEIAAIVPVSGEFDYEPVCNSLAKNNVAIWNFHNSNDPVISISSARSFIASVNSFSPLVIPRLTVFESSSHDAWTKAMNPAYKESNLNIYEWMLQYKK